MRVSTTKAALSYREGVDAAATNADRNEHAKWSKQDPERSIISIRSFSNDGAEFHVHLDPESLCRSVRDAVGSARGNSEDRPDAA